MFTSLADRSRRADQPLKPCWRLSLVHMPDSQMGIYWGVFKHTLGTTYLATIAVVVLLGCFFGPNAGMKKAAENFVVCSVAAALVNSLLIDTPYRITFFLVLAVVGTLFVQYQSSGSQSEQTSNHDAT